ncbi:MAG: potassium transporter KtrB [Clostridia bacterium]|nr:potassium transporter KtrB [Clostridia bacterium]
MKRKKLISLSTTHIILLSFLITILVGTLLLMLPISSASRQATPFIDALFTATTATCVTGLVVVPTVSAWSIFGQLVILALIQIGGLGIITVMSGIMLSINRKMKLSDSILIQDAFNLNTLSGLGSFLKKVLIGTAVVEGVGALLYMIVFIPKYGLRGIYYSIFTSISAFCNAGIDIIAEDSLCSFVTNPIVNITTCLLIIFGGIGYIVWWDVIRVIKQRKTQKGRVFKRLTLHSKIAISSTAILIITGAILFFIFEYNNPSTIKELSLLEKIQASFFQSITTRTAGFATIPQENLSTPSALLSLILMFIGGSPVGTAGGVKTVTITTLLLAAISAIKNKNHVSVFGRRIPKEAISKSIAVVATSFSIMFISTLLLSCFTEANVLDIIYETVSATATVGLTRALTPTLTIAGKIIITATMYLGRVGPISLAVAFLTKKDNQNIISDPTEEISVG